MIHLIRGINIENFSKKDPYKVEFKKLGTNFLNIYWKVFNFAPAWMIFFVRYIEKNWIAKGGKGENNKKTKKKSIIFI